MSDLDSKEIVGKSIHSSTLRQFVEEAAARTDPAVLLGEPGVGKQFVARRVHQQSARSERPLLIVDCSLYYERELKRELFGYHGAGVAAKSRKGLLEFASRGTCYLSHVEELSPALQKSLLEFLQSHRFRRLGDGKEVTSSARVIVSSDKNLGGFVEGGLFDGELFRLLSSLSLTLVPLCERPEDICDLVTTIERSYCDSKNIEMPKFDAEVLQAFQCFPWPGNYEELKKEVIRLIGCGRQVIERDQLSLAISSYWYGRRGDPDVRKVLEELDGYIREFTVLSRLDAEFGDVLLSTDDWDLEIPTAMRKLGEQLH